MEGKRVACVLYLVLLFLSLASLCDAGIPEGFSTFFQSAKCPDGWEEVVDTRGRLLLSVVDGAEGGITVNTALSDHEDRSHFHGYTTDVVLSTKEISADSCCDGQGACSGTYTIASNTSYAASGLPFTQLVFCTINQTNVNGSVPFGTIGYFLPGLTSTTQCPDGWVELQESSGRFLVPGYDNGLVSSSASPLSSGEDRTHTHAYNCSFTTNSVEYIGVAGCCNDDLSASMTYSVASDATDASSSNLPYIQLLTCASHQDTFEASFPPETLLYNEVSCTGNWTTVLELAGRFLVALPEAAVPGADFGGPSLQPDATSNPQHLHGLQGEVQLKSCEVGLAAGCCASGYAEEGNYLYQCLSDTSTVDFPYLFAPLCIQTDYS